MIKTIDVECNAANPNLPLKPMFAFVNSPSSIRVRNVPKRIGDWCIRKVYFTAVYPDSTVKTAECVLTGGVWVGTIEGSTTAGTLTQGYTILADGVDENGNDVTGYVLGKGDVEIMQSSSTPEPEPSTTFVRLQDDGTGARDGVMYPTENGYVIQQNGEAHQLGTPFEQITAYVDSQVSSKAEISDVEDLSNSLSNYYTKSETSSNVELNTKFDTKADLSALTTKADVSALNTKRGIYDLELYADSVLDAPYYAVNVKYADVQETAMDVLLKKMSGSTSLWVWQSGDGKSISLQKAGASTWMFTYQNLEDLSQNPQSSIFSNFSIDYPTQTLVLADSYFRFEIKSYAGMIASQDYVNTQVSGIDEISAALSSKQDKLTDSESYIIQQALHDNKTTLVFETTSVTNQKFIEQYDLSGELTHDMIMPLLQSYYNHYLTKIYIGNGISCIGSGALSGYRDDSTSEVLDVFIPKSVKEIKDHAFYDSQRFGNFYVEDGLLSVGEQAFYNCYKFRSANFPNTVVDIASNAFGGTYNELSTVYNNKGVIDAGIIFRDTTTYPNNYPFGMEVSSYINFAHAASKEWVLDEKFRFKEGSIKRTARPPYTYNCGLANNTTTVLEISASSTTAFRVVPDNYGASYNNGSPTGGRREMYFVLILGEGVTRPMTWHSPTVVDKFQGGSADAIAPESGKTNIYHIFEYQEGHFAVEKLGWNEEQLSTKADLSAIPTKTSELSNDSGFLTSADIITKRDLNDMTVKGIPPNAQQSRFNITDGTITNNAYYYDEGRWESGQTFAVYTTLTADVYELKKHDTSEWVSVGTFSLDSNYEATITNDGITYSIIGYAGDLVVNTELSSYATKSWVMEQLAALSVMLQGGN